MARGEIVCRVSYAEQRGSLRDDGRHVSKLSARTQHLQQIDCPSETFVGQSETTRTDDVHQAHVCLRVGINRKASQISCYAVYEENLTDLPPKIERGTLA